MKLGLLASALVACTWAVAPAGAADRFADLVGPVRVGAVKSGGTLEMPYITWGGDVATFHANGGLETQRSSIYGDMGLDLKLVAGDDFVAQVRRYMEGRTPFLRGTMRMLGQASEVIGSDPRTKPVVFLQLTWSAGDHMVARGQVKRLEDLEGKTIALQRGGPHVGMLDDALRTVNLGWDDVKIVWTDELTGPDGPAERFRREAGIDACMVITPDMLGLTGGLEVKGSGAEGTVRGATVVVSTQRMSRSIADVYAVRKDFFDGQRETVEKVAAGYFKASEELVRLRAAYEDTGRSAPYEKILKMTQDIYGPEVIPTLEVDAHGLLLDATFVGLPGNASFFEDAGNLNGFEAKQRAALDLATDRGYANVRAGFLAPRFDYQRLATLAGIERVTADTSGRFEGEITDQYTGELLDDRTIVMFTISFEPNQERFDADDYGPDFLRAVQAASTFGNAVVAIRGHSDPTKTLSDLVKAGMSRDVIRRSGHSGSYQYFYQGRPLDLTDTAAIVRLVESGSFAGGDPNPLETMQAALNLSRRRAEAVKAAIAAFAKNRDLRLDLTQIQPVGVGVSEPLIAKPTSLQQAMENMRVEFRVLRVPAEAVKSSDFDF
jgi:hypothetical protein